MSKIIIAIDGYSSCGKSSTAKGVAKSLGYQYIDTGAMYRAVTLYFIQNHISLTNPKEVDSALDRIEIEFRANSEGKSDTYLNGLNVEEEIRKLYVADKVSDVAAIAAVRHAMVREQQRMGKKKGFVLDGRDIGTVVFPGAELKIFMTADPMVRAQRRQAELLDKGELVDLEEVLENIKKRDIIDTTRDESPLRQADDAHLLDTTFMTLDEQIEKVVLLADTKHEKA
ncbi:cytidylate kinase [Leadbetterella byssophila DSM 17132]|uniref:Cytidylate kinase n=1 Tax=Leadbetterella byssophila (strain DSM 17132 / JCM 16389 / KACC 11308 / NBRC 106382 / 4M15) TaxID=649349 RepID=E4RYJ9_LEAB4|nr:(d)CMP kinase [Leadbetterella byssophila]ADQ19129.1 cytidylate kinase [Leadbetterella byssophila DSM 17132]